MKTDNNSPQDAQEDEFAAYHRADGLLKYYNDYKERPNETAAVRVLLIDSPEQGAELKRLWEDELQDADYAKVSLEVATSIVDAIYALKNAPYNLGRDILSNLAMSHSLCPIHFVDWAICFDDEDPECDQVRFVFPKGHDT